jgi:outer membrane protein TolC
MRKKIFPLVLVELVLLGTGMGWLSAQGPGDKAAQPDSAGKKIPLEQAVAEGIKRDAQYRNRRLDAELTDLNRQKARMKKLFTVDLSGAYLFKSEQLEIAFPGAPSPITAGSKHNYDLKLSVLQPIFTGKIPAHQVEMETQQQLMDYQNAATRKIEVAGLIKSSYFTCRMLESKRKSLSVTLENLTLHLKKISDLYQEELVKRADLLETEIKLSETEMKAEELDQLLEEEKINFTRLCGLAVKDIETDYDEPVGSLEESFSFFKIRHPALKILEQGVRMQVLKKKILSGSYLPQVNGFSELHWGRPGIDFFKNQWSLYFQGGINVNLRIFDGNQLQKDKKIADLAIRQLNNRMEELILEMKKNLARWYRRKKSMENQLALVNRLVKFASEDKDLKEALYNEQQVSHPDFLAALLDRERYEALREELLLQVRLIKININTLIGRYGEEK